MAQFILKNAYLTVNTVNLSDHVASITLNYGAELQDDTAMADDSRSRIGGLKDWSVDVEFHQDFASAKVDQTIFTLVGTSTAIEVRPDAGSVSATNPKFTGSGILESYPIVSGAVGDLSTTSVTFQGTGDLTRATS